MLPKGNFPEKVYVNGEIVSPENAKISVFDRGFLFGDGIYEVMVQLENGVFYKKAHLDRLQDNLKKIGIDYNVEEIDHQLQPLLKASDLTESSCLIYIQVTRGTAPRKHSYPKGIPASVMMYALPYSLPTVNPKHMKAILEPDFRWHRCDIKSISLLGNIMANEAAMSANSDEAALVRDGMISEGSHTNIFFVKNGTVITHPADKHILNGITRMIALKLCNDLDIPVIERPVAENEIEHMDEAFFTGTTTQVASIAQLGDHIFYNNDQVGDITKKLQESFAQLRKKDTANSFL
ncbi:MAG: aminotransferase class IV [Bacteroidota bacterium]|uniref:Aminotransferase class IV n=1 Tax=Flagellimonas profundi TaxID=2915620 RepID=A0ABS3FBE2_9FLAO|nr:aminotransferase class IV [Allomuricauda profundi]MBO0340479.1 aminotransferase class IV [Allomuricauda profundi]MEC7770219.1 aminotransferase class IV [Bacteroidota bacterium]